MEKLYEGLTMCIIIGHQHLSLSMLVVQQPTPSYQTPIRKALFVGLDCFQ